MKDDLFFVYETLYHIMARLSLLEDLMENGEISLENAAKYMGDDNERISNLCKSLIMLITASPEPTGQEG